MVYLIGPEEGEKKVWEVKNWPNQKRIGYMQQLRDKSDKPPLEQVQLTTAQLQEMEAAGGIIANHSHTHPMFDQCTEEELRDEFRKTKQFYGERQLRVYNLFAYPNGNYSSFTEKVAKEEGICLAFLFDHKLQQKEFNRYRISRLSVTDQTSVNKLHFILSGWHLKARPFIKKACKILKA